MKKVFILFVAIVIFSFNLNAQLSITPSNLPVQITNMVNNFVLSGVTVSNVIYTGGANTIGSFSGGSTTNLGLSDGIILSTGVINGSPAIGSPASNFISNNSSGLSDPDLANLIPAYSILDASVLEFDLVPVGNVLEFQYVFASEEYPEWVGSSFNDVFGFFINGQNPAGGNYLNENIAIIPGTILPVAIDNVNGNANSQFYFDNQTGTTIVFDGFTTVLMAQLLVTPGTNYHLKIAIGDAGDQSYDSGIFLKAQSMKSYNSTTGISNSEEVSNIIYPNPAKNNLEISLTQKSEIEIINVQGQILKIFISEQNHTSIDISDFPKGIYFVKIKSEKGIAVEKFMKEWFCTRNSMIENS